jgi:hypothetical protein
LLFIEKVLCISLWQFRQSKILEFISKNAIKAFQLPVSGELSVQLFAAIKVQLKFNSV